MMRMSMRKQLAASIHVRLLLLAALSLSLSSPALAALGSPRVEAPPITAKTTTATTDSGQLHVQQPQAVLDQQHNDNVSTATSTTSTHEHDDTTNDELLEWVLGLKGGYWNTQKQRMGYDKNGLFGVFATQVIEDNEILAQIPWTAVLKPPSKKQSNETHSNDAKKRKKQSRFDNCDTVTLLKEEFEKGNASYYHHYTRALQETAQVHRSLLPAYWSEAGQALLQRVVSDTLPPKDIFLRDFQFKQTCQSIHHDATVLVLTHGEDFGMVPLTDRYNSRGGDYTGAYFSIDGGRSQFVPGKDDAMQPTPNDDNSIALEIRAWRQVQPGEQIFTDYHDYGQIGTPELLRDYGFVELYPQKYIFHDERIAFDIDLVFQSEEEEEEGDYRGPVLQLTWLHEIRKIPYFHPFDHNPHLENRKRMSLVIQFLQTEHDRLQQHVCPFLNSTETTTDQQQQPTPQEVETAIRFCHATMVAMEAALHDLGIPVRQRSNLRRLGILGSIGRNGRNDEDCPDGSCSDEL